MLTRTPLILLSALAVALAGQPLLAQDQLVKQALKKIASVEAAMPTLAAGDIRGANRLLADLKWANKRLNAAYKKNTSFWKDASKRLAAADKSIRATASASPTGKPTGTQPAPTSGGAPIPAKPASGSANGATGAKAASGPVIGEQFAKLQQLHKEVMNGFHNLNLLNKTFMGDAYRVGSTAKEVRKLQARLAEFPSDDKNVKIVAAGLQKFAGQFAQWQAEYKADQAAAPALTAQLDAISAKYGAKNMPGAIFAPFEQDKLRIWASRTKELQTQLPADIAVVQKATDNAILGKRAKSMLHWVGRSVPNRLNGQVSQVQQVCESAVNQSLATAKSIRDIKPDDDHAIVNRVLTEGALERSMKSLQDGMEAVDVAATLDLGLQIKDGPDRAAQRKQFEDTIVVLRQLAKASLAKVRMPKPVKLDAEQIAKLTKIATDTLARKKYGTHEILQLIVTTKLSRKEKTEGDIRGTVTGATITSYHYVWDEYRVVTAEKVGDEVWIYHNLLKFYHSSDSVTPQDQWILSRRFQSTQILPENLPKNLNK
tara:strand:+ start:44248 stop:45873 length:1626 start_codon:yes stop_codon:yes gene_type:complete